METNIAASHHLLGHNFQIVISWKQSISQGRICSKPGPVQKKMWGPGAPNTIIGLLLPPTVHSIKGLGSTISSLSGVRGRAPTANAFWNYSPRTRQEDFLVLMWGGGIFVGVPVRPNMPNMPKSASAISYNITRRAHRRMKLILITE